MKTASSLPTEESVQQELYNLIQQMSSIQIATSEFETGYKMLLSYLTHKNSNLSNL